MYNYINFFVFSGSWGGGHVHHYSCLTNQFEKFLKVLVHTRLTHIRAGGGGEDCRE
jgi:hypothetical protein